MDQYLNISRYNQDRLTSLLQQATGLDNVNPEKRPRISASVAVMVDREIGTRSTQRISLQARDHGLALCTWPAELRDQAKATYRTGRAQRILDFLAGDVGAWQMRPNLHLAYRFADINQRLYLDCRLGVTDYIYRWLGGDFDYVRCYHWDRVREDLWPWLLERQYVTPGSEQEFNEFLGRLKHRDAYLRPSIQFKRPWPWAHAVELDRSGTLVSAIRAAIAEVLTLLEEPLPPACTATMTGPSGAI